MNDAALGLPLVEELVPAPDPADVFVRLSRLPHCGYLDSALRHRELGRYSYVAADPFRFTLRTNGEEPANARATAFAVLRGELADWQAVMGCENGGRGDLPPFQGGAIGCFGYELARETERLPRARFDEFGLPSLALGWYDVVIAFDHRDGRTWIISQGLPETGRSRRERASTRLAAFREHLAQPVERAAPGSRVKAIRDDSLAPQFAVDGLSGITSNFSRDAYLAAVRRAIEYIHAGDVFQVNLSQRLLAPAADDAVSLYLRLREQNPAPFAAYFDAGEFQIASASPERFLRVDGGRVETRPIKGTRPRLARPEADLYSGDELQASEKDRAENVMIVDLLRNDLSRVCRDDSVRVTRLCGIEEYQFVQHLVSVVQGELAAGRTSLDALAAAFPGGSVTGAPKIRAMEIIAELEPTVRGPYCGLLGYIGFDGSMDTNILIRTITAARGWWQAPVGGGIVAQSQPEQEYAETWHKAEGLLRAMRIERR